MVRNAQLPVEFWECGVTDKVSNIPLGNFGKSLIFF